MLFSNIKKGQVAVFVIVALVVVGGVLTYFLFKDSFSPQVQSAELEPVFEYYQSCIKNVAEKGLSVAGSQGGWIEVPEYAPGSSYSPSSSHLNFLGNPVPYWMYVSANGVIKEQVPSINIIEEQLSNYVEEELLFCDFRVFLEQGIYIESENPEVSIDIKVSARKESSSSIKGDYEVEIPSKFGSMYSNALKIYQSQKKGAFLENYSVDVLRLYAPVDGVGIGCSPKIWKFSDVKSEIEKGLEANIISLRTKGDYYSNSVNKYFII